MVRTVFYNKTVCDSLSQFKDQAQHTNGLIIGKACGNFDLAVKLVATPLRDGKCDKVWLLAHAMEIMNMLPGGLFVIGAFEMSPSTLSSSSTLKQVMKTYYENIKTMDIFPYLSSVMFESSSLLSMLDLNMDGELRSIKQLNPNNQFSVSPAQWTFKEKTANWKTVTTKLSINYTFPYGTDGSALNLQDQMKSFYTNIYNAIGEVNDEIIGGEKRAFYDPSKGGTTICSESNELGDIPQHTLHGDSSIHCKLYLASSSSQSGGSLTEMKMSKCLGEVCISGVMHVIACVVDDSTAEMALNALKLDAILSLYQRWNMTYEENVDTFYQLQQKVVLLPKRIVYEDKVSTNPVMHWIDYADTSEEIDDCVARVEANLNCTVDHENFDDKIEVFYTPGDAPDFELDDEDRKLQTRDLAMVIVAVVSLVYCVYNFFNNFGYNSREPNLYMNGGLLRTLGGNLPFLGVIFTLIFMLLAVYFVKSWVSPSGDASKKSCRKVKRN